MRQFAFTMKLKPGNVEEYKRRHERIWPELAQLLRESGISQYSIFLDEKTGTLFGVQMRADGNTISELPKHPLVKKWWDHMAPLMEVNPDHSPVCGELHRVFHLE